MKTNTSRHCPVRDMHTSVCGSHTAKNPILA